MHLHPPPHVVYGGDAFRHSGSRTELRANDHPGNSIYEQFTAFTIPCSDCQNYRSATNDKQYNGLHHPLQTVAIRDLSFHSGLGTFLGFSLSCSYPARHLCPLVILYSLSPLAQPAITLSLQAPESQPLFKLVSPDRRDFSQDVADGEARHLWRSVRYASSSHRPQYPLINRNQPCDPVSPFPSRVPNPWRPFRLRLSNQRQRSSVNHHRASN